MCPLGSFVPGQDVDFSERVKPEIGKPAEFEKSVLEAIIERARSIAVSQVLGDFPLKLDITWYDEKFDDPKGREVWDLIHTALGSLHYA